MKKSVAALTAVILCAIIIGVLFTAQLYTAPASLYVAGYVPGFYSNYSTYGNIVLVNPTGNSLSDLNMTIKVDNSELILPTLRLWHSNYTVNMPSSHKESSNMSMDVENFSTPITTINIEPNQNLTINIGFPATETFQFSPHNLTIYLSQNSFADTINGQILIIPQTMAYLQVVDYSSVQSDYDTYHGYFNWTLDEYMIFNDNPNFYQRYHNISWEIGSANHKMMARMNALGETYFNVTVFNNNTFPVNSVALVGQIPSRVNLMKTWYALLDYVMQPSETYLFPVGETELPTYAYATGYITNSTVIESNT